jgi:hypothetical protein
MGDMVSATGTEKLVQILTEDNNSFAVSIKYAGASGVNRLAILIVKGTNNQPVCFCHSIKRVSIHSMFTLKSVNCVSVTSPE